MQRDAVGTADSGTGTSVLAALRTGAEREWGPLVRAVRTGLRGRGLAAMPMTICATFAILAFQVWQQSPAGAAIVEQLGVVRASLPLHVALSRTPLSLFVPAPDLPVWGAALQVFVVFGIAELTLGRIRTLVVAYAATLAATMYARQGIAMGPDRFFGLSYNAEFVRDTGPSVAVVALAVCIAWRYRARLTGAVLVASMISEAFALPNLAGAEHLVAILSAISLAAGAELVNRQTQRTNAALNAVLLVRRRT
ncbi:hypothetical protein [Streptacidiphilus jiangxiensis]|uniref:Uncharacterized protein n=1 Tax=Streptacidiphilus jiangxiensis TaxID=235985 RepID=A0A1H7FJ05_STRJI|nr:hypothetical protein [Streptacidiphilus jiangxiensis]SEK24100.1 hypothetical protein SAMN05414137_101207 [Streptacidiphilus jiangxiensis]